MNAARPLALGLDSSTQSLTAVVVDIDSGKIVHQKSLDYAKDPRLCRFGIDYGSYIVPPRQPGEADQPPLMYLASLDAMFADLVSDGVEISRIGVVNDSGQQHGHLYLSSRAESLFARLREPGCGSAGKIAGGLASLLAGSFAYGTAPIWKTSNTSGQAEALRRGIGGSEAMIRETGSDSPLRFTGAVIRRVGEQFPAEYEATATVELISSFIPAVLTGNSRTPWDFGNGCGTSLMSYTGRAFSRPLIAAASEGLPGGQAALEAKLPGLVAPDSFVGSIAAYFVERYGFSRECRVCAGSGDNPQSKVLVDGDLLSLGTSFVNMVATDGESFDLAGYANGMYDGVGRPFMFGCRTNGALVWDRVRELHGLERDDFRNSDSTLATDPPGTHLFLWQPDRESFPASKPFDPVRVGYSAPELSRDYPGIIESTLGLVRIYSEGFAPKSDAPIFLTGGVTKVAEIVRRVAAIWNRPVITVGTVGAALGAAVAGAAALSRGTGTPKSVEELSAAALPREKPVDPIASDVATFHRDGGYLVRLRREYERVIAG
jgi:xylulokinase